MSEPDFFDWLQQGIALGFCAEPDCTTHNGFTLTEAEEAEFEEGLDPCIPGVRLWPPTDLDFGGQISVGEAT